MSFAPYCVRCKGRHFFHESCLPERATPFSEKVVVDEGLCSGCVLLQRRVAELEGKLEKFRRTRAKRNAYQKDYMQKRRDAS